MLLLLLLLLPYSLAAAAVAWPLFVSWTMIRLLRVVVVVVVGSVVVVLLICKSDLLARSIISSLNGKHGFSRMTLVFS